MANKDRNVPRTDHDLDAANTTGQPDDSTNLDSDAVAPNPPRTTTGKVTAPKFGSAGSGGAELEPGPERD